MKNQSHSHRAWRVTKSAPAVDPATVRRHSYELPDNDYDKGYWPDFPADFPRTALRGSHPDSESSP